ncbi:hypothetical protein CVD27_18900 [Neobacillus cucumis]|uniref:Uncharacterized protein n=1 Tax=Neobacillus cucumis TaxID=1740721 RepID=A0A2N5HAQ5_9BACI|nr:hypothetical protein CVD27_18900 [Neobacillus cucumis]
MLFEHEKVNSCTNNVKIALQDIVLTILDFFNTEPAKKGYESFFTSANLPFHDSSLKLILLRIITIEFRTSTFTLVR